MKQRSLLLPLAALVCSAAGLHAATITWGASTNITGLDTDVSTTGTPFNALLAADGVTLVNGLTGTTDAGKNVTVNGVDFAAGLLWTGATSQASSNRVSATVGATTMNSDYRTLLLSQSYLNATNTITLSGLSSGDQYQIQVWVSDLAQAAGKTSTVLDGTRAIYWEASATESAWGQFVIGTFTADAGTQTFTARSYDFFGGVDYSGGTGAQATRNTFLGGIQVRAIPEPSAALLGGLGLLAMLRRRRA